MHLEPQLPPYDPDSESTLGGLRIILLNEYISKIQDQTASLFVICKYYLSMLCSCPLFFLIQNYCKKNFDSLFCGYRNCNMHIPYVQAS